MILSGLAPYKPKIIVGYIVGLCVLYGAHLTEETKEVIEPIWKNFTSCVTRLLQEPMYDFNQAQATDVPLTTATEATQDLSMLPAATKEEVLDWLYFINVEKTIFYRGLDQKS
jgi:hypothetical protein